MVPVGNAGKLCDIPGAEWNTLKKPQLEGRSTHGIAADLRADLPNEWEAFVAESAVNGIPVYHYKQLSEGLTGKVEIEHLSENNLGSLLPSFIYLRFKQSIDFFGGSDCSAVCGTAVFADCTGHQKGQRRPGILPAGTHGISWTRHSGLEIPNDGGQPFYRNL